MLKRLRTQDSLSFYSRIKLNRNIDVGRFCTVHTDKTESFRRPFQRNHPDFYDEEKLEQEMRRVFDVCHGCRACFNLCESFPTLFDMVDKSPTQELDSVPSTQFAKVVDDCTLCDMCFMVSCPYVPPHSLDIDFPHLIARYKAVENRKKQESIPIAKQTEDKEFIWPNKNEKLPVNDGISQSLHFRRDSFLQSLLSQVDLTSSFAAGFPDLVNKLLKPESSFRNILESIAHIDKRAKLPEYVSFQKQLTSQSKSIKKLPAVRESKRKVVLYGTCISQYNKPDIGLSAKRVLERNGVEVKVFYNGCCGMPQFERGDFNQVEKQSKSILNSLIPLVKEGYTVVSVVASCSLMLKKEWPHIMPDNEDVKLLSQNTLDISEYVVKMANDEGIDNEVSKDFTATVSLHNACHTRAQNIGFKSRDMLSLFKGNHLQMNIVQRCSGHGGIWGTRKENFDKAMKVGKQAINQVDKQSKSAKHNHYIVSDCPLAAEHLGQGMEMKGSKASPNLHPIEIVALAYGIHPSLNTN